MKGLSRSNVIKEGHCEKTKEMLDRLEYVYQGEGHEAHESFYEPCYSYSEPDFAEVVVGDKDKKRR